MKNFKSILAAIVTIGAVLPVSAASVDYGYCADEPAQYGASALSTTNYAVIQIPAEIAANMPVHQLPVLSCCVRPIH